jgi:hypothetical protein
MLGAGGFKNGRFKNNADQMETLAWTKNKIR